MKLDKIVEIVMIYLGIYTFVINPDAKIKDFIEVMVLDEKKLKIKKPQSMYTGKFSMLVLNNVENTRVNTSMWSKGFNKLHKIPRNEPLYFFFTSFLTNKDNKKEYF
jgi:hypothetical protein